MTHTKLNESGVDSCACTDWGAIQLVSVKVQPKNWHIQTEEKCGADSYVYTEDASFIELVLVKVKTNGHVQN